MDRSTEEHRPGPNGRARRAWLLAGLVAFVGVFVFVLLAVGDDDDQATGPTTTSTSSLITTTTVPATTTTTQVIDTSTAVWPTAGSGVRYEDPVEAARGFAEELVGFRDPLIGEFRQGDARSGEVEVRPNATGPVTTVFVRQLGPGQDWSVLGSATANIQVETPATGDPITSPVALRGTSTAFEANVSVALVQDGDTEPLATGFVMGGSMGELGPFDGELAFPAPTSRYGALVFTTLSMADGSVWEASVIRVQLAP